MRQGQEAAVHSPLGLQEQKVYVQHRLQESGPLLWELLDRRDAHFFLAG